MSGPLILLTNDDGAQAPGLLSLADSLQDLGDVWVVAPENQQSASSHALTLHKPLRIQQIESQLFSVSGTPTDCVFLAVRTVLKRTPDLLISGINGGPNLGDDVSYSGTVSAALEGALMGFPSVAISRCGPAGAPYDAAAKVSRSLMERVLEFSIPERGYLNINIPEGPLDDIKGVQVTGLGLRRYSDEIVEGEDPRGRPYYWIGGSRVEHAEIDGTDCTAVDRGYVSVTPLTAKWDQSDQLERLRGAGFESKSWN